MLNNVVLVGRLVEIQTLFENDTKSTEIVLSIPRNFKNAQGKYDNDFIKCILQKSLAETTCEYCEIVDIVGIKGRIESNNGGMCVIAEKVTFLSSKKEVKNDEN